jgi:hypothetical protein
MLPPKLNGGGMGAGGAFTGILRSAACAPSEANEIDKATTV